MVVAKAVEYDAHLYTLSRFARQQVEKGMTDAIILEFEIVQMNEAPGSFNVGKQRLILAYSGWKYRHGVAIVEGESHRKEVFPCLLRRLLSSGREQRNKQEQGDEYRSLYGSHP